MITMIEITVSAL